MDNQSNRISIKLNGSDVQKKQQSDVQVIPFPNKATTEEDALTRLNQLRTSEWRRKMERPKEINEKNTVPLPHDFQESYPMIVEDEGNESEIIRRSRRFNFHGLITRVKKTNFHLYKRPLLSLFASLTGAISLGLLFGYIVLTVFMQENGSTAPFQPTLPQTADGSIVLSDTHPANTNATAVNGLPAAEENLPASVPVAINVPEQSLFMVQAGVFSDKPAANVAIQPLEKQGLPHLIYENEGKQHLFVATAPSRDDILGLASFFKGKQMEVYVKEVKLPGVEKELLLTHALPTIAAAPDKGSLDSFFIDGLGLARELSVYSSRVANHDQKTNGLTAEEEAKLREMHRRFLEQSRIVQDVLPKEMKSYIAEMVNGMNQAVSSMTQTKTKTTNVEPYAWQVQKGVLIYLESYVRWVQKANES